MQLSHRPTIMSSYDAGIMDTTGLVILACGGVLLLAVLSVCGLLLWFFMRKDPDEAAILEAYERRRAAEIKQAEGLREIAARVADREARRS